MSGFGWNPPWSSFDGDCCGLYVMEFANGVHAAYEGSCTAAASTKQLAQRAVPDRVRAGSVSIGQDRVVRVKRRVDRGRVETTEITRQGGFSTDTRQSSNTASIGSMADQRPILASKTTSRPRR